MRYCCTQCGATNIRMKKRRDGKLGCILMVLVWPLVLLGAFFFVPTVVAIVSVLLKRLALESLRVMWEEAAYGAFVIWSLFLLFPYIIYRLLSNTTIVCRKCKGENCLVPVKSARGQEILCGGVSQSGGSNQRLANPQKIIIKKKIVFKKPIVNVNQEK